MHKITKTLILFFILAFQLTYGQKDLTIKGVVSDQAGPLPGVTVLIKGTIRGTETDFEGNYSIRTKEGESLVFSFIGMTTVEKIVSDSSTINVSMTEDSNVLNEVEVVATGYRKIDRKLFAGVATKLKMSDIKLASESDISKSLEGQVAGVSVQNVSSTFGTAPTIRVRGSSSINGNQNPLWVIDGVVLEDAVNVSSNDINSGNIDSLISSGVAGLNMEDIEDFQILKDASATALYGARAMNGVIVITTKKGKKGVLNINYSNVMTIKPIPTYNDFNILDSREQMSVNREVYEKGWINIARTQGAAQHGPYGKLFNQIANNYINWGDSNDEINTFLRKYETANTNWFKQLFKNGIQNQHTISVSGGGEKSTFYTSLGFLKDAGWTIADDVDRYTALLKGSFFISDKFTVTAQSNMSYRQQKLSGVSNAQGGFSNEDDVSGVDRYTGRFNRDFDNNPFIYALTTSRNITAKDENGDLEYFRKNYTDFNIINELELNKLQLTVRDMSFLTNFNYKIKDNLTLGARVSARYYSAKTERLVNENSNEARAHRAGTGPNDSEVIRNNNDFLFEIPGSTTGIRYSILPEGGIYTSRNNQLENYYFNGNATWNPTHGDDHSFTFFLGSEVRFINRSVDWSNGYGHFYDLGNISKPSDKYLTYLSSKGRSYFGKSKTFDRFLAGYFNYGYAYKGKYTLNGTFRYEGSNRLGKSTSARWFSTWNIGGKWAISKEKFLEDSSWINQLNLRVGYGLNGSLGNAENGNLIATSSNSTRPLNPEASELQIDIDQLGNSDLSWEKQYEFNIGLDYGLFNNRVSGDINYYRRNGFDLIGRYQSSGVGGERLKWGNVLDLQGRGVEVSLNATPIKTDNFNWNVSTNFSYHKNTVKNLRPSYWLGRAASSLGLPVENGPVRGFYSARFAGLDKEGIPSFYNKDNEVVRYLNVQTEDFADFSFSGNLEPVSTAGITNSFTYKGLTLSTLLSGQFGHKKRVYQNFSPSYNDSQALSSHLKNRWRIVGDENKTNIPAIIDADSFNKPKSYEIRTAYQLYGMSDLWIADASFVRLKNVSLSYSFPKELLTKLNISNLRLSLQGSNLALLWLADKEKLGGEDPEFVWSGGTTLPITKQYTVTLNIGF